MRMWKFWALLTVGLYTNLLFSQDELGIAGSSRAPVNTLYVNPANICDSRTFVDVEFIGAEAFLYNNFAYIPKSNYSLTDYSGAGNLSYNADRKRISAKANVQVYGPSFVAAYQQHAFGIHSGARVLVDARRLPGELGQLILNGLDYKPEIGQQRTVEKARINALAYGYVGASYSTIVYRTDKEIFQAGVTINRLFSPGGAGVRLDNWTYTLQDSSQLTTQSLNGALGFNNIAGFTSGKGWGMDLGVVMKRRSKGSFGYTPWSPCTDGKYEYKIGISLLDLGSVKFKAPFNRYTFTDQSGNDWNGQQHQNWGATDSVATSVENNLQVHSDGSSGKLKMKLPTALCTQVDYHVARKLYALGMLTWGFPRKSNFGIQRESYLAIVPRWESKNYEVSLPMSLYDFKKPMLGLCIRFRSFIVGSDNLNAYIFAGNLSSANIYFHLKFALFSHPKCKNKNSASGDFQRRKTRPVRQAPRSPVPCPKF